MVRHNFAPQTFICAKIIPIPKGSKPALTCSDKYRSIAISNVIGKILDHVIIDRQSDCLKTCNYQFGFKPKASTVLCSTMVNETIQYYTENGGNPVLYCIVLYCIMRPYTDGPIGPLSYRHSSGVVRNPHSTLAE